jgi:uncharacterized membrane protein YhhN
MFLPIIMALIVVSAILHIRAEYVKHLPLIYIFKPLTTSLIILFCFLQTPVISPTYKYLVILGLISSLFGDIFLMLPSDQFIAGLVSFLIAHIFYIVAFTRESGFQFHIIFVIPIVVIGLVMLKILLPHTGSITVPVIIYSTIILVMLWQAVERWNVTSNQSSIVAFIGAVFFVFSDFILAYNRFVGQFKSARLLNLSTYYIAQWLIAFSVKLVS